MFYDIIFCVNRKLKKNSTLVKLSLHFNVNILTFDIILYQGNLKAQLFQPNI